MTLTHTNTQGVSGPCEAKLGRCPFGPQFTSMEEARQYKDLKRKGLRTDLTQAIDHTPTTGGISGAGRFVDVPTGLWGTMRMRDGDLRDPRNRYALANGLCGDLAAAIIRKDPTRRPVFVTYDLDTSDSLNAHLEANPGDTSQIAHVMVTTRQPGVYLDAYGVHTADEVKNFYGDDASILDAGSNLGIMRTLPDDDESLNGFARQAIILDHENRSYDYEDFPQQQISGPNSTQTGALPVEMSVGGQYASVTLPDEVIEPKLKAWTQYIGEENAKRLADNRVRRDRDSGRHITVVRPSEMQQVGLDKVREAFKGHDLDFTLGGIGTISRGRGSRAKETWYVVATCPQADQIRESLGLPKYDYHVTIGFEGWDVHDRPKDMSTVVIE